MNIGEALIHSIPISEVQDMKSHVLQALGKSPNNFFFDVSS